MEVNQKDAGSFSCYGLVTQLAHWGKKPVFSLALFTLSLNTCCPINKLHCIGCFSFHMQNKIPPAADGVCVTVLPLVVGTQKRSVHHRIRKPHLLQYLEGLEGKVDAYHKRWKFALFWDITLKRPHLQVLLTRWNKAGDKGKENAAGGLPLPSPNVKHSEQLKVHLWILWKTHEPSQNLKWRLAQIILMAIQLLRCSFVCILSNTL